MPRWPPPACGLTPGPTAPPGAGLQGRLAAGGGGGLRAATQAETPTCSASPSAQWLPGSEEAQNLSGDSPATPGAAPLHLRGCPGPQPNGQPCRLPVDRREPRERFLVVRRLVPSRGFDAAVSAPTTSLSAGVCVPPSPLRGRRTAACTAPGTPPRPESPVSVSG